MCKQNFHVGVDSHWRTLMGWGDHLDHGEGKVNHQIPITVENVRAQKSHKRYAMKLQRLIIFISFLVTINYIGDMKRLALDIGSGAHNYRTWPIWYFTRRRDFLVIPITLFTYLRSEDERKPNKIAFLLCYTEIQFICGPNGQQWLKLQKPLHLRKKGLSLHR